MTWPDSRGEGRREERRAKEAKAHLVVRKVVRVRLDVVHLEKVGDLLQLLVLAADPEFRLADDDAVVERHRSIRGSLRLETDVEDLACNEGRLGRGEDAAEGWASGGATERLSGRGSREESGGEHRTAGRCGLAGARGHFIDIGLSERYRE